jgi:uncharacterized membrane protein YgdD (TMEM256/DUF423 family)
MEEAPLSESSVYAGIGAILAAVAVMAGAFGAHALREIATPERLATFETAARYLMHHALALVVIGWMMVQRPSRGLQWAAWLFIAGAGLFSGSLFALVLLDWPALGIVTPFGGVAFIGGWVVLALTLLRR